MNQTGIRLAEEAQRFSTVLALGRSISGCSGGRLHRRGTSPGSTSRLPIRRLRTKGGDGVFARSLSEVNSKRVASEKL